MTSTTNETTNNYTAGNGTVKPGTTAVGRTSDTGASVWVYVIAVLNSASVFGVNLGTNCNVLTPEGPGMRLDTFTVSTWSTSEPLSRMGEPVREALATFLANAGLPALATGEGEAPATPDTSEVVRQAVAEVEQRHQRWIDSLVSDAHDFADENSLCSEFDRFMDEHGLPGRQREHEIAYTVTYTVTYSGYATVEATSWDEAHDLFHECQDDYVPSVRDALSYGASVDDTDVSCE